jgi:Co/Zn/Cd efflux system component
VLISSIVIKLTDFYLLDGIVGLGVSILILIAGIKILNETKNSLLGEAPVEDTVNAIKSIVSEYPEVLGMHDLMVHNYGPNHYIASLHAEVAGDSPDLDIYYLHDVIDNIEKRINQELNILCTIHMDPIVTNDESVAIMRDAVVAKIKTIDQTINVHDFRVVVGNTHTNLIFDVELPFESGEDEKRLPAKIQSLITEMNPDYFCVITVDRV